MKYVEVREQIKTGDMLAWSAGSWKNWHDVQVNLVRVFTRSEFSHVGLALVGAGRVFVLEAVGSGVRIFPLSRELPFWWVPRPREIGAGAVDFAFERVGEAYSKWQAIKAFLGSLTAGEDDRWECAEYVLAVLARDGERLNAAATPAAVMHVVAREWGPIFYVEEGAEKK